MNELNVISKKLEDIFKQKQPKFNSIDIVLELIDKYKEIYRKKDGNNTFYYLFGTTFLKNLNEYLKYLLKRKEMSEQTNFPHIETEEIAIEKIKTLFKEINYYKTLEFITNYFDDVILNDITLTEAQFNVFSMFLENNCFSNIPDSYINYYFSQVINNELQYREETVKTCIINLGLNFLKQRGINNYKIIFDDIKKKKVVGTCDDFLICIENSLVKGFKKNLHKNKYNIFITLFHELRHAMQMAAIKQKNYIDYNQIKMLKDSLIANYINELHFNFNYSKTTEEFDAYSMELVMAKRYLDSIGVNVISDEWIKSYQGELNIAHKTDNRSVGMKIIPLDILFDMYFKEIMEKYQKINGNHIFENYPILSYIYDQNGNRYTTSELINKRDSSHDEEEKRIINDILNNQIISYKEILLLLQQPADSAEYNLAKNILKKRVGLNVRKFIDVMTSISDGVSTIKDILKKFFDTFEQIKRNKK